MPFKCRIFKKKLYQNDYFSSPTLSASANKNDNNQYGFRSINQQLIKTPSYSAKTPSYASETPSYFNKTGFDFLPNNI